MTGIVKESQHWDLFQIQMHFYWVLYLQTCKELIFKPIHSCFHLFFNLSRPSYLLHFKDFGFYFTLYFCFFFLLGRWLCIKWCFKPIWWRFYKHNREFFSFFFQLLTLRTTLPLDLSNCILDICWTAWS